MTGRGPRKLVEAGHSSARLLQAREFHESARSLIALAQSKSYNSAVTLMVTAAIAYGDAITARAQAVVNKRDRAHPDVCERCWATAGPKSRRSSSASCSAARTR